MLARFLPLLLVSLTLGCLVGASGEENPSGSGSQFESAASAGSASVSGIEVATVTPVPDLPATRLEISATPTETPTPVPEPTATVVVSLVVPTEVLTFPTDTPVPAEAPPTETPIPTDTPVPSATPSPTESPTPAATKVPTATVSPVPTSVPSRSSFRTELLVGHNEVRDREDLPRLSLSSTLSSIAQQRAETMAGRNSMTHYNPDFTTAFDMMNNAGYPYTDGAENIAYNYGFSSQRSVEMVMQQWINSPSHYVNIVKGHLVFVGFGMATSGDGTVYYSAVFSD